MADVNANIIIDVNSTAAIANLRRLQTQIAAFQKSVVSANSGLAAQQAAWNASLLSGIGHTGMFNAKMVTVADSVTRFSDSLEKGRFSLGQYTRYAASSLPGMSRVFRKEFDTISQVAESRVKRIQTQYLALGKTVDGMTKAIAATPTALAPGYMSSMAMATQRQQIFNRLIDDGSTKLLNWGKNTQWAGRQLMVGFSIPLAALGAVAAKTFMEIDKATLSLRRVYGDLSTTTEEINTNIEAIQRLGKEYTKYGISVAQSTEVAARAAATGAQNETLMAATEQTLRFATLGQIEYQQALEATISLQTAFGIGNEELASKIDFLNAVENQTILTIDDMSLAIPRVATVIKGLGGSVEDLAVMMTAMREGGVTAENAANALKSGLASLINPTKRATESMGKFGINITEIVNKNKGDLMGLITDFANATNALDEFSRQQVFEQTFGKYQYARMSALFTNITKDSGQAARAMDLAGKSAQELAAISDKELSAISETTSVKFKAAVENLKTSIAPLGEAFLKVLTPIANAISSIANAFNHLPDSVKNVIAIITGVVAGIGPVLVMTLGLFANAIANIVKVVQFFRKSIARIRGDASAFEQLTNAEQESLAATKALEAGSQSLTGKLLLQREAVAALTLEYEKFAAVAGIAGVRMGGVGGRGAMAAGARPFRLSEGGTVPGTGNKDTVPALLTPGETVVTKEASQKYRPIIDAMNSGNLPAFSKGTPPETKLTQKQKLVEEIKTLYGYTPPEIDSESKIKKITLSELGRMLKQSSIVRGHSTHRIDISDTELSIMKEYVRTNDKGIPEGWYDPKQASKISSAKGYTNWVLGIPMGANAENYTSAQWATMFGHPKGRDRLFQFLDQEIGKRVNKIGGKKINSTQLAEWKTFKNEYSRQLIEKFNEIDQSIPITDSILFDIDKEAYDKTYEKIYNGKTSRNTNLKTAIEQARTHVTMVQFYNKQGNPVTQRLPISVNDQNTIFKRSTSVPSYPSLPKLKGFEFMPIHKYIAKIIGTEDIAETQINSLKKQKKQGQGWKEGYLEIRKKPRFIPRIGRYNTGGPIFASNGVTVPGVGNTDTVPAMLTPGEFVVNKGATEQNLPLLHAINDGNVSQSQLGFNKGGQIPGMQYFGIGGWALPQRMIGGIQSRLAGRSIGRYMKDAYTTRQIGKRALHGGSAGLRDSTPVLQDIAEWNPTGFFMAAGKDMIANEATAITYAQKARQSADQRNINHPLGGNGIFRIKSNKQSARIIYGTDKPSKEFIEETIALLKKHGIDREQEQHIRSARNIDEAVQYSRQIAAENRMSDIDPMLRFKLNEIFTRTMKLKEYDAFYGFNSDRTINRVEKYGVKREKARGSKDPYKSSEHYSSLGDDANQVIINPGRTGLIDTETWQVSETQLTDFGRRLAHFKLNDLNPAGILNPKRTGKLIKYIDEIARNPNADQSSLAAIEDLVNSFGRFYKRAGESVPESHFKALAKLNTKLQSAKSSLPAPAAESYSGLNSGGIIFASNGVTVPGIGNTDTVPAMLTPGEFVVNKQSTAENLSLLHAINDGNVSQSKLGFNKGGKIPGVQYFAANEPQRIVQPDNPYATHFAHGTDFLQINDEEAVNRYIRENLSAENKAAQDVLRSQASEGIKKTVRLYTNWVYDVPKLANQELFTGTEFSKLFTEGRLRDQVMGPIQKAISKAATSLGTSLPPDAIKSVTDHLAKTLGSEISKIQTDFITDPHFYAANEKAMQELMKQNLSPEMRAAVEKAYTEITTARPQAYDPTTRTSISPGRVQVAGATQSYRGDPRIGWDTHMGSILTEEGNALRAAAAQRQHFPGRGFREAHPIQSAEDQHRIAQEMERQRIEKEEMLKTLKKIDKETVKQRRGEEKFNVKQANLARQKAENEVRAKMIKERAAEIERRMSFREKIGYLQRERGGYAGAAQRQATAEIDDHLSKVRQYTREMETVKERTLRYRQAGMTGKEAKSLAQAEVANEDIKARRDFYRRQSGGTMSYEEATRLATADRKAAMQEKYGFTDKPKGGGAKAATVEKLSFGQRMKAMGSKFAPHAGGLGMALSMASMAPAMMADEKGKFMGMDANAVMMGMMGGGTLLSLLPMMQGFAGPFLAITTAVTAAGIAIWKWNDNIEQSAKKSADFGANIGMASNSLNKISELFGQKTPLQRSTDMQLSFTAAEQQQSFGEFQQYFNTDVGKKFIDDLKSLTSAERFKKLNDYITSGIAGGVFDKNTAQLFAKTIAQVLQDPVVGTALVSNIRNITQREGEGYSKSLLNLAKIRSNAVESTIASSKNEYSIQTTTSKTIADQPAKIISAIGRDAAMASSIQILQDYGNAVAKAREEMRSGIITFDDYISIMNDAKKSQQKYFDVLSESILVIQSGEISDQGLKTFNDQLSAILSPEQMDAMKKATEYGIFEKDKSATVEAQRKAAIAGAITSGMSADQAIATMQYVRDNVDSLAAQVFAKNVGKQNVLEMAAFAQTSDVLGAELGFNKDQSKKYYDVGIRLMETGAMTLSEYQSLLNSIPEERRINFVTFLNGLPEDKASAIASTQQTTSMSGSNLEQYVRSGAYINSNEYQRTKLEEARTRAEKTFGGDATFDLYMNYYENGKEESPDHIADKMNDVSYTAEFLKNNISQEMLIKLGIDTGNQQQMDNLTKVRDTLPALATLIETFPEGTQKYLSQIAISIVDGKDQPLSPEELLKRGKAINKALKDLNSKNKTVESKAIITVIQSFENEKGEAISEDKAKQWQQGWIKDFGQKKVSLYSETTITDLVNIESKIEGAQQAVGAAKIRLAYAKISGDKKAIDDAQRNLDELQAALNAYVLSREAIGSNPPKTSSGGGGGGQENWYQALLRQAKEALKILNMFSNIIKDRAPAFKAFISGPFAPEFIDFLRQQGIEAVTVLNGSVAKFRKAYDAWIQKDQRERMTGAKLFPLEIRRQKETQYAKRALTPKMSAKGIDADVQSTILEQMGPQAFIAAKALEKKPKQRTDIEKGALEIFRTLISPQSVQAIKDLNAELRVTQVEISKRSLKLSQMGVPDSIASMWIEAGYNAEDFANALKKPNSELGKILNNILLIEKINIFKQLTEDLQSTNREAENMTRIFALLPNAAQEVVDTLSKINLDLLSDQDIKNYAGAIDFLASKQEKAKSNATQLSEAISAQTNVWQREIEKINLLEIKPFENAIQGIQAYIQGLSDQIEDIQRNLIRPLEDQIKELQDSIGIIQDQIDALQKVEDETNKVYDKRIEALNKVFSINERIAAQQQSQLNVAQALSQGDVYAAAQAMQEMSGQNAGYAREDLMKGLETEKQNAILAIQDQIAEKQKQIDSINAQIEERQNKIEQYNRRIRDIQDQIYEKQKEIAAIQKQIEDAKRRQLELEERIYKVQLMQSALENKRNYESAITRGDKFEAQRYAMAFKIDTDMLKSLGWANVPQEIIDMWNQQISEGGPVTYNDIEAKINESQMKSLASWNAFINSTISNYSVSTDQVSNALKNAGLEYSRQLTEAGKEVPAGITKIINDILGSSKNLNPTEFMSQLQKNISEGINLGTINPEQASAFMSIFGTAITDLATNSQNVATSTGKVGTETEKFSAAVTKITGSLTTLQTAFETLLTNIRTFSSTFVSSLGISDGAEQQQPGQPTGKGGGGSGIMNAISKAIAGVIAQANPQETINKIFEPIINMFKPGQGIDTTGVQAVVDQIAETMRQMVSTLGPGLTSFIDNLSIILSSSLNNLAGVSETAVNAFLESLRQKLSGITIDFTPNPIVVTFPAMTLTLGNNTVDVPEKPVSAPIPQGRAGTVTIPGAFTGGPIIGTGSRDSVPVMSAPGEFIMRRAAVDKYGSAMLSAMNAGSYSMPKYDIPEVSNPTINTVENRTNVVSPVYNTYSVNVPVNQPGASADEIAHKVITKIRDIDSMAVRSFRGY